MPQAAADQSPQAMKINPQVDTDTYQAQETAHAAEAGILTRKRTVG